MAQLASNEAHNPAVTYCLPAARLTLMRFASNEAATVPSPPAWPCTPLHPPTPLEPPMAQLASNEAHDPAATSRLPAARLALTRFASNEAVTAPSPPAWPRTPLHPATPLEHGPARLQRGPRPCRHFPPPCCPLHVHAICLQRGRYCTIASCLASYPATLPQPLTHPAQGPLS